MTTPFPFVSGQTLLASQLNSITQLPSRTLTSSGNAVTADNYSRVILNGTAVTYTINTGTFDTADVVQIYNANSTAATIAAGAGVTLNGAAGLTLAQYQTAELYALSATSFVLWKSDVTSPTSGLVFLTSNTFSAATSVSLPTSTFTSTYANYRILFVSDTFSAAASLTMRMRASGSDNTTSNYEYSIIGYDTGATLNGIQASGQTSAIISYAVTTGVALSMDIYNPQATQNTRFILNSFGKSASSGNTSPQMGGGSFAATTSFDAVSFISTSNMTGRYAVYGYNQ